MKTRLIPLVIAVTIGASLIAFAAPPPKKPVPGSVPVVPVPVVPVPVPVPVVPVPVVPVRPPVIAPPKPAGPAVRSCGVERPHAAHQFRGRGGVMYRCPGKVVAQGPKGPPRRP